MTNFGEPMDSSLCFPAAKGVGQAQFIKYTTRVTISATPSGSWDLLAANSEIVLKPEIVAVYEELASMNLPKYKSVIIYYVGHGEDYYINVEDGYISIPKLRKILSQSQTLANMVKVLIFDCCRTGNKLKPLSQTRAAKNVLMVYTTALGQEAFVISATGESIASTQLIQLLERPERRNLTEILLVDLNKAVTDASVLEDGKELDIMIDFEGSLTESIDLYEDKLRASK